MIRKMINKIKAIYKRRAFKIACSVGKNFTCSSDSYVVNKSNIKDNIRINNNCDICGILMVDNTGKINVGDYTTIRYNSFIGATKSVSIGSYVIISNNVIIRDNNSHPTDFNLRKKMCESGFESELWSWKYAESKAITIEDNVWIGERAIILKGVTVGTGSIVAMASVVTKDVRPYTVVAGNPAREVKQLNKQHEN